MEEIKVLETEEQIKVFSDPYRLKILKCFDYFNEPATAKMIADRLNEVPSKVSYHIKKMEKAQILILAHTKEINGIIAKYYEPVATHFTLADNIQSKVSSQVYQNETIKLISGLYEQSKEIANKSLARKLPKNESEKGFFSSTTIYLSLEEIKEVHKQLDAIYQKYKSKKNDKGGIPFHLFIAGIAICEDENDNNSFQ